MRNQIYLVVYACEPNQGGEHEVGWQIAKHLNKKVKNLVVVTRRSNQSLIEQFDPQDIQFIFIENTSNYRTACYILLSFEYAFIVAKKQAVSR